MRTLILLTALISLLAGCAFPLKPGQGIFRAPNGSISLFKQSENPAGPSTAEYEHTDKDGSVDKSKIVLGAAQKDTAREVAAKLGSLRGVVWIGVLLFVFGVASAFYPPLKLIVGSITTSAACAAAGVALIVLPSLIVGHELLIMAVAVGGVGIYWYAHRHGSLRATVEHLKGG